MAAGLPELPGISGAVRRRYGGPRVDRGMRSGYSTVTPTNNATHTLWNNSTGQYSLIVLDVRPSILASTPIATGYVTTPPGSALGGVASVLANHAPGPGLHYYADTATLITPDYIWGNTTGVYFWAHEWPFAVLPPGYGLAIQNVTVAQALKVGFFWEYLRSDELSEYD